MKLHIAALLLPVMSLVLSSCSTSKQIEHCGGIVITLSFDDYREKPDAYPELENILKTRLKHIDKSKVDVERKAQGLVITCRKPEDDEFKRMRFLLTSSGHLEFLETFRRQDVFGYLYQANLILCNKRGLETDSLTFYSEDNDALLTKEEIKKSYPIFEYLEPNLNQIQESYHVIDERNMVGMAKEEHVYQVIETLALPEVQSVCPENMLLIWSSYKIGDEKYRELYAVKRSKGMPVLDNTYIKESDVYKTRLNEYAPFIEFTKEGAELWADLTENNIQNYIAICIDNAVYSCPLVNFKILSGKAMLNSGFSKAEAEDVNAIILHPLPVALEEINIQIIEPERKPI
jgi:preprotein translocase subunit SecD